jgi:predicted metal-binding membrane protein
MRRGPWPFLLAVSAAAWAAAPPDGEWLLLVGYCAAAFDVAALAGGVRAALLLNPVEALAGAWLLMLAAMMPPLLAEPLVHVWQRSFASRRAGAVALFLLGYAAIWSAAGLLLVPAAMLLHSLGGAPVPLAIAALVALAWQVSPAKQHCLNRCHGLPVLAAFGARASADALRFGLRHGLWCAGACWALMLLPLASSGGHVLLMIAATIFIAAERIERPRPAAWMLRWPRRGFSGGLTLTQRALPRAWASRLARRAS